MVRLLFLIVAFLLMIGAGIGGLYFWGIDPLAKFNTLIGNAPADPNKKVVAAATAPSYVDFGILIVPIIQDREVKKQVDMIIRLQVVQDKKEKVAAKLPRLQAAFLEEMMGYLPMRLRETESIDQVAVSRRLVRVAEKTLGPDHVLDVIIEQASVK